MSAVQVLVLLGGVSVFVIGFVAIVSVMYAIIFSVDSTLKTREDKGWFVNARLEVASLIAGKYGN